MLLYHDFSFKGRLASSMGVVVETQAEYIKPARRVQKITVPGLPGDLTLDEGEDAYEPVLLSPSCHLRPGADPWTVGAWLDGSGLLILGSMPNFAYRAEIINQIPFQRIFQDIGSYTDFAPIFYCQPLRFEASPSPDITVTANGSSVNNPGNVAARSIAAVYGSGDITLTLGADTVVLDEVSGGIVIDSAMGDCYSLDKGQLLNHKMTGAFPRLKVGMNTIRWTGNVSKVVITPRWWWV